MMQRRLGVLLSVFLVLYTVATMVSMAGMEIFGWLSAALTLALLTSKKLSSQKLPPLFLPIDGVLIALFFFGILGAWLNTPLYFDKVFVVGHLRWVFLLMLIRTGIRLVDPRDYSLALKIVISLLLIIGLYGVYQYFFGIDWLRKGTRHFLSPLLRADGSVFYRPGGPWGFSITFGHWLAMLLCLPTAYLLTQKLKSKWYWISLCSALAAGLALALNMTRGAYLGAIAAFFVMTYVARRKHLKYAAGIFVVLCLVVAALFPDIRDRVATIIEFDGNRSNSERITLWKAHWEVFKDYPVLGVGTGVNEFIIGDYFIEFGLVNAMKGHAHNTYLQFLAGNGILGLLCYLLFVAYCFFITIKLWRILPAQDTFNRSFVLGMLGVQVAMQIGGLTECNFKAGVLNHPFNLGIAALMALYLKCRLSARELGEKIK